MSWGGSVSEQPWTDAALATLRALWADPANSASAIGEKMNRSKNAILGKAHRLNLPPRQSPIVRTYAQKAPKPSIAMRAAAAAEVTAVVAAPPVAKPVPVVIAAPVSLRPLVMREGRVIHLPAMSVRQCQYIAGDVRAGAWSFCGDATNGASSYCAEHAARCFTKPRGPVEGFPEGFEPAEGTRMGERFGRGA